MKKLLRTFMLAVLFLPFALHAQTLEEYQVNTDVITFTSIVSTGTQASFTSADDGYATVTLPFTMPYGESVLEAGTSIGCSANGFMYLGVSSVTGTTGQYSSTTYRAVNAILQQDGHIGRYTESGVYWQYDETEGTLTIEYHGLGTYSSPYGFYSYQVVFHDNGNIEFIYDSINTGTTTTCTLATYLTDGPHGDALFLTGDWATPTISTSYADRPNSPLPVQGLRYTFTRPVITCPRPSAITLGAITANTIDITWTPVGTESEWEVSIYDGNNDLVAGYPADVYDTAYTFTGLNGNTIYTIVVKANCGGGDLSTSRTTTGRTACDATTPLPYTENFSDYDGVPSSPTSGPSVIPACWDYYSNGTNTAETASSSYYGGIIKYSYTSSYASMVANDPYLCIPIQLTGYAVTSTTYQGYEAARGNTKFAILPAFTQSLSGLQISFDYKMSSAYSATGAAATLELGYVTGDTTTFQSMVAYQAVTSTQHVVELNLSTLAAEAPAGARLAFKFSGVHNGTGTSSYSTVYAGIDNILVEELPSCARALNVTVAAVTDNSITLNWEANELNPDGTTYNIYTVTEDGDVPVDYSISGTTYTVTGLDANTLYTFGVEANCGASGIAPISNVSARTSCAAEELPFVENFSASLSSDPCWRGASNATAAQVFAGTALTLGTPSWTYASSVRDGLEAGHYYKNVFGNSTKHWLITPAIDLSTASSAQLSFDVALTDYNNAALPDANGDTNTSQAFMVIVSTDGGNTWLEANATIWQNVDGDYTYASLASTTYQTKVINLNDYLGQTIKIAFYCQSLWTGGDNDLHIDNIAVTEVPNCPAVTGLAVDDIDGTTVSVSWDNNGVEGYEVEVLLNDEAVSDANILVEDTTAVISDLLVDNDYQIHVRSICGSDYGSWSNPVTVHIGYCLPNPTSVDGQGIVGVSFGGMTNTTHPTTAGYANYTSMAGSVPAGTTATVEITYATGYDYGTIIWVDWNNNMVFEGNEVVFAGLSASTNPATLNATFDIPATTELGNYRMRILGADSYFNSYVTSLEAAATANPCASYTWGVAEDYTLTVTDAPSCPAVTGLTVSEITATGATLSWSGDAASYTIYDGDTAYYDVAFDTTLVLEGLTAMTQYTFGVVSNCGTEESDLRTVTFTTACVAVVLPYTETFETTSATRGCWTTDGPGTWSFATGDYSTATGAFEGALNAKITHGTTGNATKFISPELDLDGATGMQLTFAHIQRAWSGDVDELRVYFRTSADGEWNQIAEYTEAIPSWTVDNVMIPGNAYQVAFEMTDSYGYGVAIDSVVFTAITADFCFAPVGVTVSDITSDGATLSWTGDATSYNVYDMNDNSVVTTVSGENTATVTGLNANTAYTLGVAAICTSGESDTITVNFTTLVSCPAPEALSADDITTTSATLNWEGDATSYTIIDMADGSFVGTAYDTTYPLSGLTATTLYTYGVVADCGTDVSDTTVITFATACAAVAIPFVEDFETTSATLGCWSVANIESGTGLATSGAYSGSRAFWFHWSTNPQYLISPELSGTENGLKVSFMYKIYSVYYPESFQLGYSTTTNDLDAYTWRTEQTGLTNTTYQEYSETLPAGVKYVAIKYTAYDAYYLYIDSVVFNLPPNCMPVTNLTVDNVTETTATISWTGDAGSYGVYNGETLVANVTTNTYTFTGLSTASSYTFGVVANCSATDTSDMVTVTVTTDCSTAALTLPFSETFDANSATRNCWTTIDGDGDGFNWTTLYNNAEQDMMLSFSYDNFSYSPLTPNNWLISPKLHTNAGSNVNMTWTVAAGDNDYYAEHYGLYVSTTNTDTNSFTLVNQWTLTSASSQEMNVDLSTYAGQDIYVAFRHFNCTNEFVLIIDDVEVYEGAYTPDTLTVTFAVNNATMGTTNPVPGTYQYLSGDTIYFAASTNVGYHFAGWQFASGTLIDTINASYISAYVPANAWMSYGNITLTALFEVGNPDSIAITYAVNDPTMGTITPAPGIHTIYVGNNITAEATPNAGYELNAWVFATYFNGALYRADTIDATNSAFANPMNFGPLPQSYADNNATITITALFQASVPPVEDSLTIHLTINDPTLGSILPAPGDYSLALNDTLLLIATPNSGVNFIAWRFFLPGQSVDIPFNPFEFVVNDNFFGFGEFTIEAIFRDTASVPDSVTVIVNTADPTMGTTDPVPGTYTFAIGEQSVLTAVPNTGYDFLYWIETMTFAGETFIDTFYTQTVTREFSQLFANWAFEITAYFEPAQVPTCETPTGVHVTSIDAESISLAWDANDNVESWNVRYRVQGTEAWTTEVAYVSTHTINSLTPLTTYEMQVQADCGAGNVSDWTASVVETTVGINNYLESNVNLYPNPAKEYVDVRIDGDMNVTAMEVYDVFGKLINTVNVIENTTRINVSNLADGMYFVRVTTEQGVVTKRFLKK